MTAAWRCPSFLLVILFVTKIWAQDPPVAPTEAPLPVIQPSPPNLGESDDRDDTHDASHGFIVPDVIATDEVDKFVYKTQEYLMVKLPVKQDQARWLCESNYNGQIGFVETVELGKFLAEALSETNLVLDSLWTGGTNVPDPKTNKTSWQWVKDTKVVGAPISTDITGAFVINKEVKDERRNCLTFARKDHDKPQFQPLMCDAMRPFLCQRAVGKSNETGSTHVGWIELGEFKYKIMAERVRHKDADRQCYIQHKAALAVITTFENCQKLGRYLLIGRPSLENAWIGGEYKGSGYWFTKSNILLANKSDATGFPPWRKGEIQKTGGCLLLDRHISNITLFVEARCSRLRPYICYKESVNATKNETVTIIIGPHAYRLHYNILQWGEARDYCLKKYAKYSSKLVEPDNKDHVHNLLYVMGENRTAVQHIWIGGVYNETKDKPSSWIWDSTGTSIPMDGTVLNWIKNDSYTKSVDDVNICLNMDRENHLVAMHYGTICSYSQAFVCYFTAENAKKLLEDESKSAAG